MQQDNAKIWEERYTNHPITKEVVREYHTVVKNDSCSIF